MNDYKNYQGPVYSSDKATQQEWEEKNASFFAEMHGHYSDIDRLMEEKFFLKIDREDIADEHDKVKLVYAIAQMKELVKPEIGILSKAPQYFDPAYAFPMDTFALQCGGDVAPMLPFKTVWKAFRRERTMIHLIADIEYKGKLVRVTASHVAGMPIHGIMVVISNNNHPVFVNGEQIWGVDSRDDAYAILDVLTKETFRIYDSMP